MHAIQNSHARLLGAVAISIAAHLCFLPFIGHLTPNAELPEQEAYSIVTLVPVSDTAQEDEAVREPEVPEEQFVDLPEPEVEEVPEEADFADRFNRTVEREMRDRNVGEAVRRSSSAAGRGSVDAPAQDSRAASIPRDTEVLASLEVQNIADGSQAAQEEPGAVLPSVVSPGMTPQEGAGAPDAVSPDGEGLDLTVFNAAGRDALTERQLGRQDHLQLEDADRTMVNSARNLYWSFFTRMKRQVQVEWDPVGVYRSEDPSGRLYQQRDRYTVLAVTLGAGGTLEEASVERSCGLEFLDEEAIRAFRSASPFPNVPEGLKDDEGLVDVKFGFMLSLSGSVSIDRLPEF